MSLTVFFIVLCAAALHASWNALVKGGDSTTNMIALVLGHGPFAVLGILLSPLPSIEALPWLVGGAFLHFGYQLFLLRAYQVGEFTQVYPIARGSAPLIVSVVSVLLWQVHLSAMEWMGIALICTGIAGIALVQNSAGLRDPRAAGLALIVGMFIASYSLTDGTGARIAGTSLGFYGWLSIGNLALTWLYATLRAPDNLRRVYQTAAGRRAFLLGGGASFIAYALVTWAFTQAPIALVTALRESSIVFALLFGVLFMQERPGRYKILATAITLSGVVLLRLATMR